MTERIRVYCDGCTADLSLTTNAEAYRLIMFTQSIPNVPGGRVHMKHVEKPLERTVHFCGLGCVKNWVEDGMKVPK